MPREAEPSVNEKEFILKALHEGVRLDGRPFDQYRNIDISFGDEYGVVDEQLRVASCTISLNKHGEVCQASKLGGDAVEATTLLQCAALAARKVGELSDLVDRTLAADAKRRDKGGLMAELSAENDRVAG
ncbi:Putative cutinase 4 [Verticillium dahliae VDG1]|nr:Putative cutinase 4 [Verticillium dahliae VDG1]